MTIFFTLAHGWMRVYRAYLSFATSVPTLRAMKLYNLPWRTLPLLITSLIWNHNEKVFESDIDQEFQALLERRAQEHGAKRPDIALFSANLKPYMLARGVGARVVTD